MRTSTFIYAAIGAGLVAMLTACSGSSTTNAAPVIPNASVPTASHTQAQAAGAIPKGYTLTDLGAGLPGSPGLVPSAIDDHGVVVGTASIGILSSLPSCAPSKCGPPEGWTYADGTLTQLAPLGSDSYTFADDINDAGTISGGSAGNVSEEAVLWHPDGNITNLGIGVLGSQSSAEAASISNSHKIVGLSYDSTDEIPTAFERDGHASTPCGSSTEGLLEAVSDNGLAVGYMFLSQGGFAAITCPPLTNIESPPDPTFWDIGFDINDKDQVVGRLSIGPNFGNFHPFLYWKGKTTDLGTLFSRDPSAVGAAFGINSSGVIVGFSATGGAARSRAPVDPRAFIYNKGKMVDLNSLLPRWVQANWRVVVAEGINNKNQVVCAAYHGGYPHGVEHAVLLSPQGSAPAEKMRYLYSTQVGGGIGLASRIAWTRLERRRRQLHLER